MTELSIRKTTPAPLPQSRRLFPERFFDLMGWDPFREIAPVGWMDEHPAFAPAFEVKESEGSYQFIADVPGVKDKDLQVMMTGNRLTISGKRLEEKREEKDTYYAYERSFGSFSRAFTLPEDVDTDHMSASLKDGVLTIALARKPESRPKNIIVTAEKSRV